MIQKLKDISIEFKIVGFVALSLVIGGLFIGFFSVLFIRADVLNTAMTYSNNTAFVISRQMNEVLAGGNLNDVRTFISEQKNILNGIDAITVLNFEGRDLLFNEIRSEDRIAVNSVAANKSRFVRTSQKQIVFYYPLVNSAKCAECHSDKTAGAVIGSVKILMSAKDAYERMGYRVRIVIIYIVIGTLLLSALLWMAFRMVIIRPVKAFENSAKLLSQGDLSIKVPIRFNDEMGRLGVSITKAVMDIGKIIQRVVSVSNRVVNVTVDVEKESKKVVEGSLIETEAISRTSESIEELNKSIGEIAESVSGLIASTEQTAVSSNEMATTTEEIAKNAIDLSIAVDSASSSMEEMSRNINEIAGNAGELSRTVEETLSAVEEINSTIKEIESNTKESARLSAKVTSDATSVGMAAIEKTADGMERIKSTVLKTAGSIEKLSNRSEEIGKILNVIDEITDQTTLLALNAAILAAQAGEYGKGFAVVADEIKDLAERTSYSTQEISSLIQSVQTEIREAVSDMEEGTATVNEGAMLTKEAKESFAQIIESSKHSAEMVAQIENATYEQTKGIGIVTDSMGNIKSMSAQIAEATIEQSKEVNLIMSETEKIREISKHVKNATLEQSKGERQLHDAAENISVLLHEISSSINKQKINTNNIFVSMERIMTLPEGNRSRAFQMNKNLRSLLKDAEILMAELRRFKLSSEVEIGALKMGIVPLDSPAEMYRRFTPLAEYLAKKLDKTVDLRLAVDFAGTIGDFGEGITNICYMTPSTYIEAKEKYGIEVLVKAMRGGRYYHHAVIIAKAGGKIKSLDDIKGASFAFGDSRSTSSYIVPRAMLLEAGIDLKDLSYYDHLGHHDGVAAAVLSGEFDAGGVMDSTALRFKDKGLNLLKYSFEIPEFNFCVNGNMPEKDKFQIKQALLELDERNTADRQILKSIDSNYTGFMEAADKDYEEIRSLMRKFQLF
ncbi:MAG: phosphate/phosphite/phosphonate ABC transporter substrate-binding protein [Nitrospirae bacterium]|nr:phosphate/phosphite/phosphonate ABC transporter substrate-binding protein [Nitrospirota bacterium]